MTKPSFGLHLRREEGVWPIRLGKRRSVVPGSRTIGFRPNRQLGFFEKATRPGETRERWGTECRQVTGGEVGIEVPKGWNLHRANGRPSFPVPVAPSLMTWNQRMTAVGKETSCREGHDLFYIPSQILYRFTSMPVGLAVNLLSQQKQHEPPRHTLPRCSQQDCAQLGLNG